jgi:hypothetical protein
VALGGRIGRARGAWLLAPLLYAGTFGVPNGMLAGLVDASEATVLTLLALALLDRRWWALPLLGVLGGLAKETFMPLSAAMAGAWWLARFATERRAEWRGLVAILAMTLLGLSMPVLVKLVADGQLAWPWALAVQLRSPAPLADRLWRLLLDPGLYYPFVWLVPLAFKSWRLLPTPWRAGSLAAAVMAFLLGLWADAGGANVGRPIFNVLGAPLSLAAATTLLGLFAEPAATTKAEASELATEHLSAASARLGD